MHDDAHARACRCLRGMQRAVECCAACCRPPLPTSPLSPSVARELSISECREPTRDGHACGGLLCRRRRAVQARPRADGGAAGRSAVRRSIAGPADDGRIGVGRVEMVEPFGWWCAALAPLAGAGAASSAPVGMSTTSLLAPR